MGAHVRTGHVFAARLRRPGAGALVSPAGTFPAIVCRASYAGLRAVDASAVVPYAASADDPRPAHAAGGDDPQESAAPSAVNFHPGGSDRRQLPDDYR